MASYGIVYFGQAVMWACLLLAAASAVFLAVGKFAGSADSRAWGYRSVYATCAAALLSCLLIVVGFYSHNVAFLYVAQNYPTDTGSLFWLYQLSGLWAGRAGSLLLWTFLISAFAAFTAYTRRKVRDDLTTVALMVVMVVVALFTATMAFSSSNNPFVATPAAYIGQDGALTGAALTWGMNVLLEHWAMVLHPPMLFIGYAGMTVPFAYGIAALATGDGSARWVDQCQRIALFAFVFLTVGIGLGAVWAYVVLGWGGYWGWDPVENASLLSWLTSVAMLHSFNVFRRRPMMGGWAQLSATLTFAFVVLGTFITRSGLVQSVHAFSSDNVSTVIFILIMAAALLSLAVLWLVRRKDPDFAASDDIESVASKNGSYYLTALVMVFAGVLLAYLTVSSALPAWMPAGGVTIGTGAYESISRPLGIVVCLLAAVCPFLSWRRTDGREFWRNLRLPLVVSLVVFALLVWVFLTILLPSYNATIAQGDVAAQDLRQMGPSLYYNGLALLGLFTASLLACCSLYLLVRGVRGRMRSRGESAPRALRNLVVKSPANFGGYLTHLAMGVVLVGLVGSAMYVTEKTYALGADTTGDIQIGTYTVAYNGVDQWQDQDGTFHFRANLGVSENGVDHGTLSPSVSMLTSNGMLGQARPNAQVYSTPEKDLFTALAAQQDSSTGMITGLYLSVRVNPLIWFVWVGFALMVAGVVCSTAPRRGVSLSGNLPEQADGLGEADGKPAGRSGGKAARVAGAGRGGDAGNAGRAASPKPRPKFGGPSGRRPRKSR